MGPTIIRPAVTADIHQLQYIRNAVRENRLSDPRLVSDYDCEVRITVRGKGWVAESEGIVCGFSIVDLAANNVWALFVHPDFERRGIGRQLHDTMLNWYFLQNSTTLWLSTAPGTRAETFYRKAGWSDQGMHGGKELKFEMSATTWSMLRENER